MFLPLSVLRLVVPSAFSFHAYARIAYILFASMDGVHLAVRIALDQDRISTSPFRAQGVPAGATDASLILGVCSDIGSVE